MSMQVAGAMLRSEVSLHERAMRASKARAGRNRVKGIGHPTTAEMDYSTDEVEFMAAIQAFKAASGRQFPTWSEVLRVIRALGYTKDFPETTFDKED